MPYWVTLGKRKSLLAFLPCSKSFEKVPFDISLLTPSPTKKTNYEKREEGAS